ncbi:MAG: coproporphyrinogen III oxidase [Bacteroidetes bacterium ADurb.Bin408]|nr:MAG: coproporphyrinogen III oxidase [Bacteroidetes bacterium ADurb.Bin408]
MKILFYCCGSENLGVEALSAYLKQAGHEVALLFDPQPGNNFYFNMPFINRCISRESLIKKALAFSPELIAVSFLTNQLLSVRTFMRHMKKHISVPVIAGGIHATVLPEELIKEDWVNMLCVGEGEGAMAELAEKMSRNEKIDNIANLWIKKEDGTVIKNRPRPLIANLDAIPIPDKNIFVNYGVISRRLMVMTSRGCPYTCTYCINSYRDKIYEKETYLRRKSVAAVIDELVFYKEKYKPAFIQFYDDVFSYNKAWLREFNEPYKRLINLPYECYITPSTADDETLSLLKSSGCVSVIMGVQSGSEEVRKKLLNRHYSNNTVIETAKRIKKYRLKLITEYIFGLPGDDYHTMISSYELNDKLNAHYTGSFIFYPFAHTHLTEYCIENGYLSEENKKNAYEGIGSMHYFKSLINNPDKELIYKFYAVLPLYNKMNKFFKKVLVRQLNKKWGKRHRLLNVVSVPLIDISYVMNKVLRVPCIIFKTRAFLKNK